VQKIYTKQINKNNIAQSLLNKYWIIKLKKYEFSLKKNKQANMNKALKLGLFSKTRKIWNLIPKLNKKDQFSTNLILKDEIKKLI